jgi:hypothetical protein
VSGTRNHATSFLGALAGGFTTKAPCATAEDFNAHKKDRPAGRPLPFAVQGFRQPGPTVPAQFSALC